MSKRISLVILVLGLIFSSILRIKFNLNDGFQFHGIWFNLVPMPILDFGGSSGIEYLSSTIIGYFFYLIYSLGYFKGFGNHSASVKVPLIILFILNCWAIFVEFNGMVDDVLSQFDGAHFRAGPLFCLLGVLIYDRLRREDQIVE